jgi:hypothetical protein
MINIAINPPTPVFNRQPYVENIYNNGGSKYDHIYKDFIFFGTSITRTKSDLNDAYSRFVNLHELTPLQKELFDKSLNYINLFLQSNNNLEKEVKLSLSVYDEAIISRTSKNGIYNIVIDSDGDVMLSFSGFKEYGWRKFIDAADFKPSKNISDFFSV